MNPAADISVLLASDIPMLRGSVVDLLNDAQSVSVVACAESHGEVLPLAEAHRPQLAILDLDINRENLADLTSRLTEQKTSVLLMSDDDDISQLYELFVLGLRGVIQRRSSADLMCRSVRAVALQAVPAVSGRTSLRHLQIVPAADQPNPLRRQVVVAPGRGAWHATAPRAATVAGPA